METRKRFHLFEVYGIELEYMIVDRDTLNIKPISDLLFQKVCGQISNEYVNGAITWCNELVLHVIELKCTSPTSNLEQLESDFELNIRQINELLKEWNGMLMPTAAHPWMQPETEAKLWPHDQSHIYDVYNKIFDCKGHGWSNLQSMHINLPFYDDEEFVKLHNAIRIILPLIPALSASSPILDGRFTGFLDKRLSYYQYNQRLIPSITGQVIPEMVPSKRLYHKLIYDKIARDIKKYDPDGILEPVWVNSRGAIARFDRGSIEIRIIDLQECPKADLGIAVLIIHLLKLLVREKITTHHELQKWKVNSLHGIFQKTIKFGRKSIIDQEAFLRMLGIYSKSATVGEIWEKLVMDVIHHYPSEMQPWKNVIDIILSEGSLAERILNITEEQYEKANLKLVYRELCANLAENKQFDTCATFI
ncbi:MAG: carboxylate-amine ligase [Cyclobacteriaceae bacterium]|jgi:carboxylate-amine ligase